MVCPLSLRVGVRARVCVGATWAAPHHLLLLGELVADTTTWFSCLDYNYPLCTLTDGFLGTPRFYRVGLTFAFGTTLIFSGMVSRRKHCHLY